MEDAVLPAGLLSILQFHVSIVEQNNRSFAKMKNRNSLLSLLSLKLSVMLSAVLFTVEVS